MNRRGFLGSILALGAAPAIVRAESLMSLWTPPALVWEMSPGDVLTFEGVEGRFLFLGVQWTPAELRDLRIEGTKRPALEINRISA
jgi:hypothetical protein